MPTTQDERSLKLTTPLAKDYLMIKRVRCREGLNQLFRIELEILHEEDSDGFEATAVDAKKLLGNPMLVAVKQAGPVERFFHGICINFTQGSRNGRFSKYRAELVPKLWMLTQISQSRIFQNKTVPQILEKVLQGYEFKNEIQGSFKPRNYCVQYRESDWDFASRMMEEEGIYYYFEHTADNHRLIMANTPPSHRPCPSKPKVTFALDRSELKDKWTPSIHSWRVDNKIRTGKYELWDYNFQLPTNNLLAAQTSLFDVGGNKKLEHYDWPGGYAKRFDGIDAGGGENPSALSPVFEDRERTVQIRQEELDVAYKNIYGTADCCSLTAGYRFQLKNHPAKENNINHVLVNVQHEAIQSPSYISDDSVSNAYMVNFVCIPHGSGHAPFRPLRKTLKPVVHGSQTAKVVGRPGDEIFTDKYGRVKVQFCWDREGKNDNKSSCWIRVGTLWAGKQWGVIHIPRVGQEVIVDFIEGDPDCPIIVGSVYNPDTMPPYTLPDNKTQSGVKSRSSKGGSPDNFNEFRFEDLKDNEEIYLHAEKNWTIMVENDKNQTVGHDETLDVVNNRTKTVGGEQKATITKDMTTTVTEGNQKNTVNVGNQTNSVETGKQDNTVKQSIKIESTSSEIKITAATKITLEVGASMLTMDAAGNINLQGSNIQINGSATIRAESPDTDIF
jgi:type VI secretion system secreted protein VgrG